MPSPFTQLLDAFDWIVQSLRHHVAVRSGGRDPLPGPLVFATYGWIGRCLSRFAAIVARVESGKPGRKPRPSSPRPAPAESDPVKPAGFRLPTGWGWLLPVNPPHIAIVRGYLERLLAQPDMDRLAAQAPGVGRVMRPLARMLALDLPPCLRLPPRPRRKTAAAKRPISKASPVVQPPRPTIVIGRDGGVRLPNRHLGFSRW